MTSTPDPTATVPGLPDWARLPTTTQITTIDLDISPLAGDFASDYDWDAITSNYAEALASACGVEGVTICLNGDVIATVEQADLAREIDWREVAESVDASAILSAHETTRDDLISRWAQDHREDPTLTDGPAWWVEFDPDYILRATRATTLKCDLCGQPERPYGPVTWVKPDQPGPAGAAYVAGSFSFQHGCGDWNSPAEWELDAHDLLDPGEVSADEVNDRLDAWWAEVQAEWVAAIDGRVQRLTQNLREALDEVLDNLDDINDIDSAHEYGLSRGQIESGEPGVYREGSRLISWDYHPVTTDGETVDVEHTLTAEQAARLDQVGL